MSSADSWEMQQRWNDEETNQAQNDQVDRLFDEAIAAYARSVEQSIVMGRFYEACVGFCHEGLQVHEIAGQNTPDGFVRFGFCSADVRVPISALPTEMRPTEDSDRGLYSLDDTAWPSVMKDAMRPLAEHALKILRDGGSGC